MRARTRTQTRTVCLSFSSPPPPPCVSLSLTLSLTLSLSLSRSLALNLSLSRALPGQFSFYPEAWNIPEDLTRMHAELARGNRSLFLYFRSLLTLVRTSLLVAIGTSSPMHSLKCFCIYTQKKYWGTDVLRSSRMHSLKCFCIHKKNKYTGALTC
jgi:hypothetical protein